MNTLNTLQTALTQVEKKGELVNRRSGSWCMMKKKESTMLELHNVSLVLEQPYERWNTSLTKGILLETLDYFLGLNPGYAAYWYKIYREFSAETGKLPYTYGERIFEGINQWDRVVDLISIHPSTRQAGIVVHRPIDRVKTFVPCTYALHFQVNRNDKLEMTTMMRSQDVYRGLPMDLFAWTMFHEQMCLATGLSMGSYTHFVCNLHLYEKDCLNLNNIEDEVYGHKSVGSRAGKLLDKKEKAKVLKQFNFTDWNSRSTCDGKIPLDYLKWFVADEIHPDTYWSAYLYLIEGKYK